MKNSLLTNVVLRETKLYLSDLPKYLKERSARRRYLKKLDVYKKRILNDKVSVLNVLPDATDILSYIEHNNLSYINMEFVKTYFLEPPFVYFDNFKELKYVLWGDSRLYYPGSYSDRHIRHTFQSVLMEQDEKSPHLYLDDGENLKDVILFDCGCAEGNLSFKHINELRHTYLFEGDPVWINALKATFSSYEDKVTIVNAFLGIKEGELSLRSYIEDQINAGMIDIETDSIFIKMDVEGAEPNLMKDIVPLLVKFKNIRLAVCVYHKKDDEARVIQSIPEGFKYRTRPGYMFFPDYEDDIYFPYFRHGVLRIERLGR